MGKLQFTDSMTTRDRMHATVNRCQEHYVKDENPRAYNNDGGSHYRTNINGKPAYCAVGLIILDFELMTDEIANTERRVSGIIDGCTPLLTLPDFQGLTISFLRILQQIHDSNRLDFAAFTENLESLHRDIDNGIYDDDDEGGD